MSSLCVAHGRLQKGQEEQWQVGQGTASRAGRGIQGREQKPEQLIRQRKGIVRIFSLRIWHLYASNNICIVLKTIIPPSDLH